MYRLEYVVSPYQYPIFRIKNNQNNDVTHLVDQTVANTLWNPTYLKLSPYQAGSNVYYQLHPNQSYNYLSKYKLVYYPLANTLYPLFQIRTIDDKVPYPFDENELLKLYDWTKYDLVRVNGYTQAEYPLYRLIPKLYPQIKNTDDKYYNKYLKYKKKYLDLLKKYDKLKIEKAIIY